MGIKLGSVILTILFLFIAKISFEATMNSDAPAPTTYAGATTASRGPASVDSIDEGYAAYMNGPQQEQNQPKSSRPAKTSPVP